MVDLNVVDNNSFESDALHEAVKSYKEAMRKADQDLNVSFLIKTLKSVNESSAVKVARNPLTKDHQWNPETKLYNVRTVEVDDENRLTVRIRKDRGEISASEFLDRYEDLKSKIANTSGPVMLAVSSEKSVQLTDVYSHAFVGDRYAGLPVDLVLGYYEED